MGGKHGKHSKSSHKGDPFFVCINRGFRKEDDTLVPATLDVYATKQFKLLKSVNLPVGGSFISSSHPSSPKIFICGMEPEGEVPELEYMWEIDASAAEPVATRVTEMPRSCMPDSCFAAVCCHGDDSFFYLLGPEKETSRFDFQTKTWTDMADLPVSTTEVVHVMSTGRVLAIVTESGQLWYYDESEPPKDAWTCRFKADFPRGHTAMIHDTLYTFSPARCKFYRCDISKGLLQEIEHQIDDTALMKNAFVASCGETLFFLGPHYSQTTNSILEVQLKDKHFRSVVSGYLREGSLPHTVDAYLQ